MSNINEIKSKHQYIKKNFDFDLFEIEYNIGLCYQSFMWNDLPTLKKLIKSIITIIPHQSDCIIGVDVTEDVSNIVINVSLTNMWDKSIKESFNIIYKNKPQYQKDFFSSGEFLKTENMKINDEVTTLPAEPLTNAIENWDKKYETSTLENAVQNIINKDKSDTLTKLRSAYYGSEEYLKKTQAWHDLPEKTEIQCGGPIPLVDMVAQDENKHSYEYDEIKSIVFNVCSNNLKKDGEQVTLTQLSNKIKEAIKPLIKVPTNKLHTHTLHVWTETVGAFTDINVHSKIGDIAIHVDIFEAPFGKLYNFVFVYETNTKQTINQEPKYGLPKYSEFETTWEPKVNIENTTTNKNYREHITNLIHKVTHERSWCFLDRTQRLEKLLALITHYMESFRDFEFSEITDEDSSLLHDYIYNVSIVNTNTNVCETIRVTGRFETEKNKNCIADLEYNWMIQEEIPLTTPTKQATSYDGSDVHYNAYCRVKQLYSGYGCGQPNEKIEIQPKEGTNYPAFLTKTDMSILRILTSVYLLSGEIGYDNYVCEQVTQVIPDKKCKIVRKEKLVDTYFYISNHSESVWAKVFILELVKPTIEKPVTKTVNIDYEQLQILIKSYNDNGGNITYDYDMDRLVEGIDQRP